MTINSVASNHGATAHASTAQPAKKPNVNFNALMNASQAAQPSTNASSTIVTTGTPLSQANKA